MYRKIKLASPGSPPAKSSAQDQPDAQAAAVFLIDKKSKKLPAGYAALDEQVGGMLGAAVARAEFSAAKGELMVLYPPSGYERVYLIGLGKPERFDSDALRTAAAKALRAAWDARLKSIALVLKNGVDDLLSPTAKGHALADGISAANFTFKQYKGAATPDTDKPLDLTIHLASDLCDPFEAGLAVGKGVATARELAATPPNVANPAYLVKRCRKLAKGHGLTCRVIDAKKSKELNMGGLLAVGGGGSTPPAIIALEYSGKDQGAPGTRGQGKKEDGDNSPPSAPVLLVGKAITFDTGGYSLKSTSSMQGMKYDKCGGMAVIGAMEAVGRLKPDVPVVGLIPTAENMIDTAAYRVDDIVTFHNKVTAEITNTDAEGRLVLADALAYGTAHYQPRAVIDLATLTGGVVVALGSLCAGLWCNDDKLAQRVNAAADASGERIWPLPLWDEHRELMKGNHADLVNSSATRECHATQGAAFLSYFVGEDAPTKLPAIPWGHLDIAGVAESKDGSPLYTKGPTGWGVRLLAELLTTWK